MLIARPIGLAAVILVLTACGYVGTSAPPPRPGDFGNIRTEFAKRGLHPTHIVSGDAGCANQVLAPTAISFDAAGLDQANPVKVYLYIFRNRAAFERLRGSIDACARSYVTDPEAYETAEESPFVLAGQGPWSPGFEAALRAGLKVAAGTGD